MLMGAVAIRNGSKADICIAKSHVRFTAKSGHPLARWEYLVVQSIN